MKKAIVPSILFLVVFLFQGCAQKKDSDVTLPTQAANVEDSKNTVEKRYNEYLLLMDEDQRSRFFKLTSDLQRDRFLQAEGVKQKRYLSTQLHRGMEPEKVSQILGRPESTEVDITGNGKEARWIYEEFNGYRSVKFSILFRNDKLEDWSLWLY